MAEPPPGLACSADEDARVMGRSIGTNAWNRAQAYITGTA